MNKILTLIFILFLSFNFINCDDILPTELQSIKSIADKICTPNENPCNCGPITCSPTANGSLTVASIVIYSTYNQGNSTIDFSSVDFSVFSNLIILIIEDGFSIPPDFIQNQISYLSNLTTLEIFSTVTGYDAEFSNKLTTIKFNNFRGKFYAKWVNSKITQLFIQNVEQFTIEGSFGLNLNQLSISIPIPLNGLPNDFDLSFPNLTALDLFLRDVDYTIGGAVPSSYLGSFNSFNMLMSLTFSFDSNVKSLSKSFKFPNLNQLTQLTFLSINADVFELDNNQTIDFSTNNNKYKLSLEIEIKNNTKLFKSCNYNCIKFPFNSKLKLNSITVPINSIDLSNVTIINLEKITPKQIMDFNNFNFDVIQSLTILNSSVSGDLPENLCNVSPYNTLIQYNLFSGKIPFCYLCANGTDGTSIRSSIIPNQFKNFNIDSPVKCDNSTSSSSFSNDSSDLSSSSTIASSNDSSDHPNSSLKLNIPIIYFVFSILVINLF